MAYTPINWQTGDTITAEKMNKMDNGWEVESTQLFSETVTTEDDGSGIYGGQLAYSQPIDADPLTVTYDGTSYTCAATEDEGAYFYGAQWSDELEAFDFSVYPFYLYIESGYPASIVTQTAGEHTIAAAIQTLQVSSGFSEAIKAAVDLSTLPFRCVPNVTTYAEMRVAADAGRLLYFYTPGGDFHLVISFSNVVSATAVTAYPEGAANVETYGFDSNMVFYVASY